MRTEFKPGRALSDLRPAMRAWRNRTLADPRCHGRPVGNYGALGRRDWADAHRCGLRLLDRAIRYGGALRRRGSRHARLGRCRPRPAALGRHGPRHSALRCCRPRHAALRRRGRLPCDRARSGWCRPCDRRGRARSGWRWPCGRRRRSAWPFLLFGLRNGDERQRYRRRQRDQGRCACAPFACRSDALARRAFKYGVRS